MSVSACALDERPFCNPGLAPARFVFLSGSGAGAGAAAGPDSEYHRLLTYFWRIHCLIASGLAPTSGSWPSRSGLYLPGEEKNSAA